jgi:hypothetical protein
MIAFAFPTFERNGSVSQQSVIFFKNVSRMYNPSNVEYVVHSYYLGSLRTVIPTTETREVISVPKCGAM